MKMGMASNSFIKEPCLHFFLGFFLAIAYIPGWLGAAISTGWLYLFIVMPLVFCFCNFRLTFNLIIGLLFISYAALSLIWTQNFNLAYFILLQILILSCVFCYGENLEDLKNSFKGMALGLGVSAVIALLQQYTSYHFIFTLFYPVAGLFVNPNIYSEVSAIMLLSLIVLKLWWWIPVTLPGLILVHSRTALIGLGVGLFFWLFNKNKIIAFCSIFGIGLLTAYFYSEHFSFDSIQERIDLWADTIKGITIFGNGVGSYETMYPFFATQIDTSIARPKFAHNDLLQAFFEFGIVSFLLVILIVNILSAKHEARAILVAIGVMSLSAYTMHIPILAFIALLVAGYINRSDDTYWVDWNYWGSDLFTRIKRA